MHHYDMVGNLKDCIYPNGVNHVWKYDELNRLTNLVVNALTTPIARYDYTLNPSGHRLSVSELSGRAVRYGYDQLYRLTNETISGAIVAGQIAYRYDPVGNRLGRESTVANVLEKLYAYDLNDRLNSDSYDANGNTVAAQVSLPASASFQYTYDFENRLIGAQCDSTSIEIVYDGDGNRVRKTVNGVEVEYLVDDRNLTGYVQVMEKSSGGSVAQAYSYGLDLIAQDQAIGTNWVISFYGYDGHGNVRFLTDAEGSITDTYDYDAFGTIVEQKVMDTWTGNLVIHDTPILQASVTPNNYLYCGEKFDSDLSLYCLRARYMDMDRGRFWTVDVLDGEVWTPISLHRYLYAAASPVMYIDPSGYRTLSEIMQVVKIQTQIGIKLARPTLRTGQQAAKKILCGMGVVALSRAPGLHGHHLVPMFLGGAIGGPLVYMDPELHQAFHLVLHLVLKYSGLFGAAASASSYANALSNPATGAAAYAVSRAALKSTAQFLDSICNLSSGGGLLSAVRSAL